MDQVPTCRLFPTLTCAQSLEGVYQIGRTGWEISLDSLQRMRLSCGFLDVRQHLGV